MTGEFFRNISTFPLVCWQAWFSRVSPSGVFVGPVLFADAAMIVVLRDGGGFGMQGFPVI